MAIDNKTERYLLLLQTICKAQGLKLSQFEFKKIMGDNPKTLNRDENLLCKDHGERKALIKKIKDSEGNVSYHLNQSGWFDYLEGTLELQFIMKSYQELGYLIPQVEVLDSEFDIKNFNRMFLYHSTIKSKNIEKNHTITEKLIRALVGNKKIFLTYQDNFVTVYPLTLCQHRDELYLFAYKSEIHPSNLRKYKISRISKIEDSNESFKYPIPSKWNPKEYLKDATGLVVNKSEEAIFRVYDNSRKLISEKKFFNSELIHSTNKFDEYKCTYTNIDEFVGMLFIYGQDIEIVSDEILKNYFLEKACQIIKRNSNGKRAA